MAGLVSIERSQNGPRGRLNTLGVISAAVLAPFIVAGCAPVGAMPGSTSTDSQPQATPPPPEKPVQTPIPTPSKSESAPQNGNQGGANNNDSEVEASIKNYIDKTLEWQTANILAKGYQVTGSSVDYAELSYTIFYVDPAGVAHSPSWPVNCNATMQEAMGISSCPGGIPRA